MGIKGKTSAKKAKLLFVFAALIFMNLYKFVFRILKSLYSFRNTCLLLDGEILPFSRIYINLS